MDGEAPSSLLAKCRTVGRPVRWGVMENGPPPPGVHDPGPFYHEGMADLEPRDVLRPGYGSNNLGERRAGRTTST